MHNYSLFYASTPYEKTSKKSRKNFSEGENQPFSCCEVTFTLLKLLRYPAKVGLLQGKSYSIQGKNSPNTRISCPFLPIKSTQF